MYLYFQNSTTSFALFPLKSNGLSKPMVSALPLIPSFLPCRKENPAFVTESHLPVSPYFFPEISELPSILPGTPSAFFLSGFHYPQIAGSPEPEKHFFVHWEHSAKSPMPAYAPNHPVSDGRKKRGGSPRAHLPHNPFISGSVGFYVC